MKKKVNKRKISKASKEAIEKLKTERKEFIQVFVRIALKRDATIAEQDEHLMKVFGLTTHQIKSYRVGRGGFSPKAYDKLCRKWTEPRSKILDPSCMLSPTSRKARL